MEAFGRAGKRMPVEMYAAFRVRGRLYRNAIGYMVKDSREDGTGKSLGRLSFLGAGRENVRIDGRS